jgi:cytochrome P450
MMNDDMNALLRGNTLCSAGDAHNRLRRVVIRPVMPVALKSLKEEAEREAESVVDRLCARKRFCATEELATHLPVTIVSSAIGLPQKGRERGALHVQLLRPDEQSGTRRCAGALRNDAICPHACRSRQA